MGFAVFLSSLLEEGRGHVPAPADLSEQELRAADEMLAGFERSYRLEVPGEAPSLDAAAARWAAAMFFRACQFAVFRDVPAQLVERELSVPCPSAATAAAHYSVDLVFRLLPDLLRFARSAAEADPLVARLMRWARDWPLSSVGVADVSPVDARIVFTHPALAVLYVDRILARRDKPRLADERVRDSVRSALGLHPELAPEMAAALQHHARESRP